MGCQTLSDLSDRFLSSEEEGEDLEEEIEEEESKGVMKLVYRFPPKKMIDDEKKMLGDIETIRGDIIKGFGVPPYMIDYEYDIEQEPDGKIRMEVTGRIKDFYKKQFEETKTKLLKMLEEGA